MDPNYALIVAGGRGLRMNNNLPKQFIELNGLPVLMHTLKAFYTYDSSIEILLMLPESQLDKWKDLVKGHRFEIPHRVFAGGKDRSESVKKGLHEISGAGLVAIHDGVRPFVSNSIIHDSFFYASKYGNAVAAVKSKDSLRKVEGKYSSAVDRDKYFLVQTPQTFRISCIKKAYELINPSGFTDDATVFEKYGERIFLIEGSYENIKITTPEDISLARLILDRQKKK